MRPRPPTAPAWDEDVTAAVKHFQSRMGLRQTGVVAGATLTAMNVPASTRFKQLASSAQRLAGVNFAVRRSLCRGEPALDLGRGGRERPRRASLCRDRRRHRTSVAGDFRQDIGHQSQSDLDRADLDHQEGDHPEDAEGSWLSHPRQNPHPRRRRQRRSIPRASIGAPQRAVSYTLRQDSGASNSLGAIRIGMPNKLAVYMHDTPSKGLFGADYRFLSHGCVRVQGVYDLAEWLLRGHAGRPRRRLGQGRPARQGEGRARAKTSNSPRSSRSIWVYLTGWANGDGPANFRDDVYGIDTVGDATASAAPVANAAAPAQ